MLLSSFYHRKSSLLLTARIGNTRTSTRLLLRRNIYEGLRSNNKNNNINNISGLTVRRFHSSSSSSLLKVVHNNQYHQNGHNNNNNNNNNYYYWGSSYGTNNQIVLGGILLLLSGGSGGGSSVLLCEGKKNNNNLDQIVKKDKDGNIDWKATITEAISGEDKSEFLDILAQSIGHRIQDSIDSGIPTQLSYGFICGYCSGFTMKRLGKVVGFVFGLSFIGLQSLQHYGYIDINHNKLKRDVENVFDVNNDGEIDQKDIETISNHIINVLSDKIPSGSGFIAGFVGGIRS